MKPTTEEKVMGIGMFKTGTSSLGQALTILGYNKLEGNWWKKGLVEDTWYENPEDWPASHELMKDIVSKFNGFEDYPWMFMFKEVDEWFPETKFVYTDRDAVAVAKSDINMWRMSGAKEEDIPPLQKFVDRQLNHKKEVIEYFKDKDNLLFVDWTKGDGWKELCKFIGRDIPNTPFPHANRGIYR